LTGNEIQPLRQVLHRSCFTLVDSKGLCVRLGLGLADLMTVGLMIWCVNWVSSVPSAICRPPWLADGCSRRGVNVLARRLQEGPRSAWAESYKLMVNKPNWSLLKCDCLVGVLSEIYVFHIILLFIFLLCVAVSCQEMEIPLHEVLGIHFFNSPRRLNILFTSCISLRLRELLNLQSK